MSQENVEVVRRFVNAYNRRDVEAMLNELDPEVEWHPAILALVEGKATVYRGHEGIRQWVRDLDDVFDEIDVQVSEIRDHGDQVFWVGQIRMRGRGSGAWTESPIASVSEIRSGKSIRIRTYLDPKEALEAAGLSE